MKRDFQLSFMPNDHRPTFCDSINSNLIETLSRIHITEPSSIELLANNPDFAGGLWVMVEVDLSAFENRTRRINVSMPESLLHEID